MSPDARRHPPPQSLQDVEDRRELIRRAIDREMRPLRQAVTAVALRARHCRRGEQGRDDVDDLLGELTAQLIQQAAKFDPRAPLLPWAMGFFKFILAERGRKRGRDGKVASLTDLGADLDESFFDALRQSASSNSSQDRAQDHAQDRIDVQAMLAQLGEADRRIIEAHFFEGLSGEALAEAVGVPSAGTTRVRLHRAKERLRVIARRMEDREGGAK
jgi:RNA polymerase sigma factor (sigma-70 family)